MFEASDEDKFNPKHNRNMTKNIGLIGFRIFILFLALDSGIIMFLPILAPSVIHEDMQIVITTVLGLMGLLTAALLLWATAEVEEDRPTDSADPGEVFDASKGLMMWRYSGFGNYSTDFGWDNGLFCTYDTKRYEKSHADTPGVEIMHSNTHAGSRNEEGWVHAYNAIHAQMLLNQHMDKYPVKEMKS